MREDVFVSWAPSWRRQWHPLQDSCLENPMDGGAWWAAVHGVAKRHNWATPLSCIGEGNGSPLRCSCLENPRDGGAWWAAVCGVGHDWSDLAAAAPSTLNNTWYTVQKYFQKYLLNEWISLRGLVFHTTTLAEDGTIFDWLGLHFHVLN